MTLGTASSSQNTKYNQNQTRLTRVFPRYASGAFNNFEFWLLFCIVCVLCDLSGFWFYDSQWKTSLINSSLSLTRKYARLFVPGHYLFREGSCKLWGIVIIMFKDRFFSIFSGQIKVIVLIILQVFLTTRAVIIIPRIWLAQLRIILIALQSSNM